MQVAADPVALLLDKAWYRFTYPDVAASGIEPLDHWLAFGRNEKRQPNFYFEPLWYLQQNPDVVGSGLDPLLHYALFGEAEGRKPSLFFDPAWYRRIFTIPHQESALAHFLTYRSTGHFAPSAVFYSARRSCPKGIDLFAPLIMQMRKTNRMFLPDTSCIDGSADLFDANFYLIHGVDVLESSIDPIEHFLPPIRTLQNFRLIHCLTISWKANHKGAAQFHTSIQCGIAEPTAWNPGTTRLLIFLLIDEANTTAPPHFLMFIGICRDLAIELALIVIRFPTTFNSGPQAILIPHLNSTQPNIAGGIWGASAARSHS
jgi:hypothetical protein